MHPDSKSQRPRVRLRQAVIAAADLHAAEAALSETLSLGEPYHDPGVGLFGLRNAVYAIGDCFLEIVSPTQPDTAAGRYMARHGGDCGYMAIFDLEDLAGARQRARQAGIRTAWEIDLEDISTTHLHPADTQGAIVSLDRSNPYGTWRWGGPEWTGKTGEGAPGRLAGITLRVSDPPAVARRWAEVLGVSVKDSMVAGPDSGAGAASLSAAQGAALVGAVEQNAPSLELENAHVRFEQAASPQEEGLAEIAVQLPAAQRGGRAEAHVHGVIVRLADMPAWTAGVR